MKLSMFVVLAALFASPAFAWDCSNPANWTLNVPGNECYRPPTSTGGSNTNTNTTNVGNTTTFTDNLSNTDNNTNNNANKNSNKNSNANKNKNSNTNRLSQHQSQTQAQTQHQNAVADVNSNADNEGNNQNTEYNSNYNNPRQTPMAVAGDVQPISCKNARNGGASSPYFGLSVGVSTKDDDCDARATAQLFALIGRPDLAIETLCKTKVAKDLPNCAPLPPTAVAYAYPPGERERRIHEHGGPEFDK